MNITEPVYVPKVGDTVRDPLWPEGNTAVVKFVGDHFVVGDKSWAPDAAFHHEGAWDRGAAWVKVEPTPADRFVIIDRDGDERAEFDTAAEAFEDIARRAGSTYAPYRVARFTFAEWVTP